VKLADALTQELPYIFGMAGLWCRALAGICACRRRQRARTSLKSFRFCGVANATAGIEALRHDPLTLEAQDSLERRFIREEREMTDNSFPYVLVCSTFATIISLASVWMVTAHSYVPVLVA
jgi:hypothetical protein